MADPTIRRATLTQSSGWHLKLGPLMGVLRSPVKLRKVSSTAVSPRGSTSSLLTWSMMKRCWQRRVMFASFLKLTPTRSHSCHWQSWENPVHPLAHLLQLKCHNLNLYRSTTTADIESFEGPIGLPLSAHHDSFYLPGD